jgi:hypothetical protein
MSTSQTSQTKSKNATFQRACFTIYGEKDLLPADLDWSKLSEKLRFLAYGREICPTTKRHHLQCYAYSKTPMRLTQWLQVLGPKKHHIEAMRESFACNERYCSKEGELQKFGDEPKQGTRTDLVEVKRLLDSGKRPMEIAEEHEEHFASVMRFERSFSKYAEYKRARKCQDDRTVPDVYVRIGPPGSGKTKWLDDTFGTSGYAIAPDNTGRWYDGCDHDVILFDDVEAGSIPPFSQWKRLCDRYPFKVPVKGGFVDSSPGSQELSSSPAISYPTNGGPSSSKTPSPELRSIDVLRK